MNINDLPPPPIKPTKPPSIVRDQHKEAYFNNPRTNVAPKATISIAKAPQLNPVKSATSSKLSDVLKTLAKPPANSRNANRNVQFDEEKIKKAAKGWVWVIAIFFFLGMIGNITDQIDQESNDSPTTSNVAGTPSGVGLETFSTECFDIELPSSTYTPTTSDVSPCTLYFDEGFSSVASNYQFLDGSFQYETLSDFVESLEDDYIKTLTVNGVKVVVAKDVSSNNYLDYYFWIKDYGLETSFGTPVHSIRFNMDNFTDEDAESSEKIIKSVVLKIEKPATSSQ